MRVHEQSKPGTEATRSGWDTSLYRFSLYVFGERPTPGHWAEGAAYLQPWFLGDGCCQTLILDWCSSWQEQGRQWACPWMSVITFFKKQHVLMCGHCSSLPGRGGSPGGPGLLCATPCPLMGNGEEMGTCCWNGSFIHTVATESIDSARLKETALSEPCRIYVHAFPFALCYPVYWTVYVCCEPALL